MHAPLSGRRRTPSALRSVAALSLTAGALLIAGPLAGAVEVDEELPPDEVPVDEALVDEPASAVTITTTPSGVEGPCLPPLLALSNTTSNTDEAFTLRIDVAAPLCSPIDAAAVVYAMPDDGDAWPQTLLERVDFRLDVAGVTEVRFAKDCDAVQFDVITGVSPQVISPLGAWHGPLLFPFDVSTSLQYDGDGPDCGPEVGATTTTESTTTTTESTTTTRTAEVAGTSTIPAEVQGTSTIPAEVRGTSTVPVQITPEPPSAAAAPDQVLGVQQSPPAATTAAAPAALATTGSTSSPGVALGGLLLVAGASITLLARRPKG